MFTVMYAHGHELQRFIVQLAFAAAVVLASSSGALAQAPTYGYQVVNTYPHDTGAFTQGLVLLNGKLYESTGLYGQSSLREVDLRSGAVLRKIMLDTQYFGEGMTIFQGKIIQLTWREQTAFVYDQLTFTKVREFFYTGEGWGLTHDDRQLIMSNGTNEIRFLDPSTFTVLRSIRVFNQGSPLTNINELEYINGEIYANVWKTNWIVRIDPATGNIRGWINMTGLFTPGNTSDVLNGIAYDKITGHLLVTGKRWPSIFEVRVVSGQPPVAAAQAVSTPEDTTVPIVLTANDADQDALTFSIVRAPAHGTLSGAPPFVNYTPAANYFGIDSFTFKANDKTFDSNIASVSLTVTALNDRPVAAPESYTTSLNTVLSVPAPGVLGNDRDVEGSALTAIRMSGPSHGALTLNASGSFTYTPSVNYTGPDSFSYSASDGLLTSSAAIVSLLVTAPTGTPQVNLSSLSLSFGSQTVGTVSAPRVVRLTNSGTGLLVVSAIRVTGLHASDFLQTNSCGASVAPGAACSISVTFRPSDKGTRQAAVSVVDNASGSPRTITLSGIGRKQAR
jgi:glutamine cyclotransferase